MKHYADCSTIKTGNDERASELKFTQNLKEIDYQRGKMKTELIFFSFFSFFNYTTVHEVSYVKDSAAFSVYFGNFHAGRAAKNCLV